MPGPDGVALQQPIQVRQVMDDAPSNAAEMDAFLQTRVASADVAAVSRTCCASWRRRSSARSPAGIGDFDAAEDAVQEALLAAAVHWPRDGVPEKPRGWLVQTAERRLIDQWRSDRSRRERESLVAAAGGSRRARSPIGTTRSSCCSCAAIRR